MKLKNNKKLNIHAYKNRIFNLSSKSLEFNMDLRNISKLIVLPDYSPVNRGLPVGTVAVYSRSTHLPNSVIIPDDIGCGYLLAKAKNGLKNLEDTTNAIASDLIDNPSGLGSLGGGNHFITFYETKQSGIPNIKSGELLVLIHSGSRKYGNCFNGDKIEGDEYMIKHNKVMEYAKANRMKILKKVESYSRKPFQIIFDLPHNFVEEYGQEIVYRKGATKLLSGQLGIIPSHMAGDAVIIEGKDSLSELCWSVNHGTGRKMSRSDAKKMMFFSEGGPNGIYLPYFIDPEYISTELPQCYNALEDILPKIRPYVEIKAKLSPKSSIML